MIQWPVLLRKVNAGKNNTILHGCVEFSYLKLDMYTAMFQSLKILNTGLYKP